jgi:periplasmic mercuric ion binding protein
MKSRFAQICSTFILGLVLAGTAFAADQTAKFKVTGMFCNACQTKIEHALNKTDGVKSAKVDLNSGSATVTFDDAKVKPEQIIKIIEKEGYKAQVEKKS